MPLWGIRIQRFPRSVEEQPIRNYLLAAGVSATQELSVDLEHFRRSSAASIVSFEKAEASILLKRIKDTPFQNISLYPTAFRLGKTTPANEKRPTANGCNNVSATAREFYRYVLADTNRLTKSSSKIGFKEVFAEVHGESSEQLQAKVFSELKNHGMIQTRRRRRGTKVVWNQDLGLVPTDQTNQCCESQVVVFAAAVAGSSEPKSSSTKAPVVFAAGTTETLQIPFQSPFPLQKVRKVLRGGASDLVKIRKFQASDKMIQTDVTIPAGRVGILRFGLVFTFGRRKPIFRWVKVKPKIEDRLLLPSTPYNPHKQHQRKPLGGTENFPAPRDSGGPTKNPYKGLPEFCISREFRVALSNGEFEAIVSDSSGQDTKDSMDAYCSFWENLLWAAEFQLERDIELFDLPRAELKPRNRNLFDLVVPGLVEGRPSVLRGDTVLIKLKSAIFRGRVAETMLESVRLALHDTFGKRFSPITDRIHARFTFSRLPFRLQHHSCQRASTTLGAKLLFPTPNILDDTKFTGAARRNLPKTIWANRTLNEEQHKVIEQIVQGGQRPLPYIIFGPPGTGMSLHCSSLAATELTLLLAGYFAGKTSTVVE